MVGVSSKIWGRSNLTLEYNDIHHLPCSCSFRSSTVGCYSDRTMHIYTVWLVRYNILSSNCHNLHQLCDITEQSLCTSLCIEGVRPLQVWQNMLRRNNIFHMCNMHCILGNESVAFNYWFILVALSDAFHFRASAAWMVWCKLISWRDWKKTHEKHQTE
jgi:hypothetical protein